ncbi:ATP-binding protein [Solidesulfovibrio carbinolicus]|uniref:ATP-dependent DNA helicase n=1 Tax=Solidesulfovibrio carbinolicus TaxID=296842 RepID=A0A4P6I605_9BACT|nr:ATP-binding protein [Solidesulfovibrio carbinolicus]QAZ69559.1 ATP-dependent DNA helicase [Solidesulfovibrio carbinolicus]
MQREGQNYEKKSLKAITGTTANWAEVAKDCIAFATSGNGTICFGIEDKEEAPPPNQLIDKSLPDRFRRKIAEITVNVILFPTITAHANGGEVLEVKIPRSQSIPSTTDGRFFIRVSDSIKPVVGDEILRLATDRNSFSWETQCLFDIPVEQIDLIAWTNIVAALKNSDRVKPSIKEKTGHELMAHYMLSRDGLLTNLGILCIGRPEDRGRLGVAPVIQYLKYDDQGDKIGKTSWDDHSLNPLALIDAIWNEIQEFKEFFEFPHGLFRQQIPSYDRTVIRELLVNAIVHRPYTQRGDIFINSHPKEMTIVNPGALPIGVTAQNILHTTIRRNEHLARLFHDLNLMEREGSGFDKIYEILLSQGKAPPCVTEKHDRVEVTVSKSIIKPELIDFIAKIDSQYYLTQREKIALGIIIQHESISSTELARALGLETTESTKNWVNKLITASIIQKRGKTQAMSFFVDPNLLRNIEFIPQTTLRRIEPHRLKALVIEDLSRYPKSSSGDIHKRIGQEIPLRSIRQILERLIDSGEVNFQGDKRWRRYWLATLS